MSIHNTYAVLGLGRYGYAVAKELADSGAEVLAVDSNEAIVNDAATEIPICKCADVTDPDVIKQLGMANIDTAIIAMASNLEASVLATVHCKEAGVKTVIAKCANETHRKILLRVGADKVVFPEYESGLRLAKNLLSAGFVDLVEISQEMSMVEMDVKTAWIGKTLSDLNLRSKYSVNVIAIRQNDTVSIDIDPHQALQADMKLLVVANTAKLNKIK